MRSFKDRIARSAGRPIDAACAARAPGTVTIWALIAGVCGGIAANVGDSLTAAAVIGGGLALIGYPISWVRARRRGLWPNMALVLTVGALELLRLTLWGSSVVGTIRAVPLGEIRGIDVSGRLFEIRITVHAAGEPIVVDAGKRGVGGGRQLVEELRRVAGSGAHAGDGDQRARST
jgi:hypothetical protein